MSDLGSILPFALSVILAQGLFGSCSTAPLRRGAPPSSSSSQRTTTPAPRPVEAPAPQISVDRVNVDRVNVDGAERLPPPRAVVDTQDTANFFIDAKRLKSLGDHVGARRRFLEYVKQAPDGQYADQAWMLIGMDDAENLRHEDAALAFRKVVAMNPPSQFRGDASIRLAQSLAQGGRRAEALQVLSGIDLVEVPLNLRENLFLFWGKTAEQEGKYLEAVLAFIKVQRYSQNPEILKSSEDHVQLSIDTRLREAELLFLVQEYPTVFPISYVELRLAMLRLAGGSKIEAESLLRNIQNRENPSHPLYQRAAVLLGQVNRLGEFQSHRFGWMVPAGQMQTPYLKALKDGLQIGLAANKNIELVIADQGRGPDEWKRAFEKLVLEEKVMAVIGPLEGRPAEFVADLAAEYGVPFISLSSRSGLVEKSPFVFRFALSSRMQARAAVFYARKHKGKERFAVLFPHDRDQYAREFVDAVEESGAEVRAMESYPVDLVDFRNPISNMVGIAFPQFRPGEVEEKMKAMTTKLGRELNRREKDRLSQLDPIVDFEAMFLPDTHKAVGNIVSGLAYAEIKNVQLFGPNSWNNIGLIRRAGGLLNGSYFVDSFDPSAEHLAASELRELMNARGLGRPSSWHALGFDLARTLVRVNRSASDSAQSRDEFRRRLENVGEVQGALGRQIWDQDRDAIAEIHIFAVQSNQFSRERSIPMRERDSYRDFR